MSDRPNILFLMADQMQGRVLGLHHPCQTPHMDQIATNGVRFKNAYTPNAVCSPARASLMTGLLPHNHGVLWVTHNVDGDQGVLREDKPHWAQRLDDAGYQTGYFGKWHVEHQESPRRFGWQIDGSLHSDRFRRCKHRMVGDDGQAQTPVLNQYYDQPPGYSRLLHYGVTETPIENRCAGLVTALADQFIDNVLDAHQPWCCFVSFTEPHDPFICSRQAFEGYDVDALPPIESWHDPLTDRPNLYRKQGRLWSRYTDRQRREAAACYYANITEVDHCFGQLIDRVRRAGQLDNTIVIITSDHGELLGAHGLYCKNVSAFEEVYHIPLVISGPGIATGQTTMARVGLHDLCPTLLDLLGLEPIGAPDSRSFMSVVKNPKKEESHYTQGFAEYFGGRYLLTQRVVWDGAWKYVHNGFDFDELYNLDEDPHEMRNLAGCANYQDRLKQLTRQMWRVIDQTNDHSLLRCHYPILRMAPYGPDL